MSLVFAGVCSHAPGITGRAHLADRAIVDEFYGAYRGMAEELAAAKPDALIIVAAEHFANFFMNNMPAFAMGMAESYEGPIEDPQWLGIPTRQNSRACVAVAAADARDHADRGSRVCRGVEIRSRHHGALEFSDAPLRPAGHSGEHQLPGTAAWRPCIGHGRWARPCAAQRTSCRNGSPWWAADGISHWPATPDSGKINEDWDREFLRRWQTNDRAAMLSYTDEATYRDAGQGGFEIRTFISVAAAARGRGRLQFYRPIPIFAVGCTVATMTIGT